MPTDLSARAAAILARLRELERVCAEATPGPWDVWDGPGYVGGGKDLCIGAGETWIFNMDQRECEALSCHWGLCKLRGDTAIASADGQPTCNCETPCEHEDAITAEQRANANLIAMARTALPALVTIGIAEMERAQGYLEDADRAEKNWTEVGTRADMSYYHGMAINCRGCAADILARWAPILPAENPRTQ